MGRVSSQGSLLMQSMVSALSPSIEKGSGCPVESPPTPPPSLGLGACTMNLLLLEAFIFLFILSYLFLDITEKLRGGRERE